MSRRDIDRQNLSQHEDWYGNNIAVICPQCQKVYIVSEFPKRKGEGHVPLVENPLASIKTAKRGLSGKKSTTPVLIHWLQVN